MKNILTLVFSICFTVPALAQLLSEDFIYTGALTANGWTAVSGAGTNPLTSGGASLTKAGFINSGIGNAVTMAASGEDAKRDFTTPIAAGSVFSSFLMNVKTIGRGKSSYVVGFTSGATGSNYNLRFYIGRDSAAGENFKLGLGRGTTVAVFDTTNYLFNTTYLVTLKYAYVSGATNDTVAFHIHPANMTLTSEPTRYTYNNLGVGTGGDATDLTAFYLRQGTASDSITLVIDGIRADRTWAGSVSRVSSVANPDAIGFKIYPSVTSSMVALQWNNALVGTGTIQVVNVLGQTVCTKKVLFTEGGTSLDLHALSKGTYLVQLHAAQGIFAQKIEKQ